SDENLTATVDRHAAEIAEAQARNFVRWPQSLNTGGILADPGLTGWEAAISNLKNWLLLRAEWIDQQLAAPPRVTLEEGANPGEIVVTLESPKPGVPIYYTLDGSEVFGSGWNVAPGAQLYT